MIRRRTVGALALALSLLAGAALAEHVVVEDGPGERGRLDIKRAVKFGDANGTWRIDTFSRWTQRVIWDRGYLTVHLDTTGSSSHYDYYALVYSNGSRLRATLFKDRMFKPDEALRNLFVARRDGRSVTVTIPMSALNFGTDRQRYSWYAQTSWSSASCPRVCLDRAPNSASNGAGVKEPVPE